jgi:L-Ala-D/L-Glu epimerase
MPPLEVRVSIEAWPMRYPFQITGYTFTDAEVVVVELADGTACGRGEAMGVYYFNETPASLKAQIENAAGRLRTTTTRQELLDILPAGGARNAVDAALWDLEAKRTGKPAWKLAGVQAPRPIRTTYTLGADSPAIMAERAVSFTTSRALKLKLTGTPEDAERVSAVRAARPDVWLGVDANQGFTKASLAELMPALLRANVRLVEQPFPRDRDDELDGLNSPIPVAADESAVDISDLDGLVGRVDVVNIKLDKCGGLTRGLQMHAEARARGMKTMVGCMMGTSLAMSPALVLGQLVEIVDIDGPISLARDREPSIVYDAEGHVFSPEAVWGSPSATVRPS